MQPLGKKSSSGFILRQEENIYPHIYVKEAHFSHLTLRKFLNILYPPAAIDWVKGELNFDKIETFVLFHECPDYGKEELSSLRDGIQRALQLLDSHQLNLKAHVLMIFYRDLKVAFPERKLQREKVMSEMITNEILKQEASAYQERIYITHEFGMSNLQDTLQHLTGKNIYFEILI